MDPMLWVAVHPHINGTRILATQGQQGPVLLRATLSAKTAHPRALPWLLEALALWEGERVHAALVADESVSQSGTSLFHDLYAELDETPLFRVELVPIRRRRLGTADFRNLQAILLRLIAP